MQDSQEKIIFEKILRKTTLVSNFIFLGCHIAYLIIFFSMQYFIMGWINLGSFLFYIALFFLIKTKKYNIYAMACGAEIGIYMLAATIICGMDAGFHVCYIGLTFLAFYSGYFARKRGENVYPLIWGIIFLLAYVFLILYSVFVPPYYVFNNVLNTILFIGHVVFVFVFVTLFLRTFINYALRLEDRIVKESRTDKLTQIANRYGLYDYFDSLKDKELYALAIFDIDDFKKVNDKYGHQCGDIMLKEIAEIANENNEDFIARYGGEEFIIIRKIDNNYQETCNKIDEIRTKIQNHIFKYDGNDIYATITIGVSEYDNNYSIEDWITASDNKLYEGKNSGKNKTVI